MIQWYDPYHIETIILFVLDCQIYLYTLLTPKVNAIFTLAH